MIVALGTKTLSQTPKTGRPGEAGTFADLKLHHSVLVSCQNQAVEPSSSLNQPSTPRGAEPV